VDGLLQQQIGMNIEALEAVTCHIFTEAERAEITRETLKAWRYAFLVSGLEHPKFVKMVEEITEAGPANIRAAAEALRG
jgi:hypothetical protein